MIRLARAAIAVGAAAAVGLAGAPAASATASYTVRTYTLKNTGKHISVPETHKIRLDLRTDTDGGYSWVVLKHTNFTIVRKTMRPYKHKKGVVGFPYHTIYILRAAKTGHDLLIRLQERRDPKDSSDIARRFRLIARIH